LTVLLAGILAHFIEINFGIAIAVTRTYFWIYTALLLLVGYLLPRLGLYGSSVQVVTGENTSHGSRYTTGGSGLAKDASSSNDSQIRTTTAQKRKKRPESVTTKGAHAGKSSAFIEHYAEAFSQAGLIAVILITAGYTFTTNQQGVENLLAIIWQSISRLGNGTTSLGVVAMLLTTWLAAILLYVAEATRTDGNSQTVQTWSWVRSFLIILAASGVAAIGYWLWHAGGLASVARAAPQSMAELISQVERITDGLARYYVYLFGLLAVIAFFLAGGLRGPGRWGTGRGLAAAILGLLLGIVLIVNTNLHVVQADMAFKAAGDFNKPGAYPAAIEIYKRVNQLAPSEDYYSLYLGRAYLDQARSLTNPQEREQLFEQAKNDLIKAQTLNPLNTDHTANLARLYSLWATYQTEPARRLELAQISDSYFSRAVVLSPSNVRLWNEWAYLALNFLNQPEQALERLERAIDIDASFDWTYGQMGDVQARQAERAEDESEKQRLLDEAVRLYQQALAMPGENQIKYTYHLALGNALTQLGRIEQAIVTYETALQLLPGSATNWRIQETLARLFAQIGDLETARRYASAALGAAPEEQRPYLQALLDRLDAQP
jgi:tetratricopeptide (TPR) repeat protein